MSHLHAPADARTRRLEVLTAPAHDLRVERERGHEAPARTPGGERGQRLALERRFEPLAHSLAADADFA